MTNTLILSIECDRCGEVTQIGANENSKWTTVKSFRVAVFAASFNLPAMHSIDPVELCPACTGDLAAFLRKPLVEDA